MNIDDMKIYVTTSNKYVHIVKVFSHLFNKFWSPDKEVVVLGFEREPDFDMPSNFKFVSLGNQTYPYDFSHDMRLVLDAVEEDYFINFEENEFILRPVRFDILKDFQPYIDSNLGRIDFTRGTSNRSHEILSSTESYDIIRASQNAELRMCIRGGIWNKKYLFDHCQEPVSTYHWEAVASEKSKNDGFNILSSDRNWVISNMDGVHHAAGQHLTDLRCLGESGPMRDDRSWGIALDEETIQELIDLKYVNLNSSGLFNILEY
jgi:hypothetical protein